MRRESMTNIKMIVYHLNKIIPKNKKITIREKIKYLPQKLIPNKIIPSYDETRIEKIYRNGGL